MAPTAQKPLVGQFDWPAMNPPPQNSSSTHHHSHSHYESPFQQIDMRPGGILQSTADLCSQQLAALGAYLTRQPVVLTVFLTACAIALVALALFLCGAKRGLEKQQRLYECRRHFLDDDDYQDKDDQCFAVFEKVPEKLLPPVQGEESLLSWSETRPELGFKGAGGGSHAHAQGAAAAAASLKPDLPPFHVSVYSSTS